MKHSHKIVYQAMSLFSMLLWLACEKDPPEIRVFAGIDKFINIADGRILLAASNPPTTTKGVKIKWEIINGPAGANIVAPDNFETEIRGISVGEYQVQLTVNNLYNGKFARDTVLFSVYSKLTINPNDGVDLLAQHWICPGECGLFINVKGYLDALIPAGKTINKVYLWSNTSYMWLEVKKWLTQQDYDDLYAGRIPYLYFINQDALTIYNNSGQDPGPSDVRITW